MTIREKILVAISAERDRQDAKWGVQDRPSVELVKSDMTPDEVNWFYGLPSESEAKQACDDADRAGQCTWAHIAVEELCESISAAVEHGQTSQELCVELDQLAAVIVAWRENIERQRAGHSMAPDGQARDLPLDPTPVDGEP